MDLSQYKRVPIFRAGKAEDEDITLGDDIALAVAMAFGAVHCIAWYSDFQSHLEQKVWRSSAIAIIVVPPVLVGGIIPAGFIGNYYDLDEGVLLGVGILYTLIAIIYIAARLTVITISFTSLRALPFVAYQTVQWSTFTPHI